eukprot:258646_1
METSQRLTMDDDETCVLTTSPPQVSEEKKSIDNDALHSPSILESTQIDDAMKDIPFRTRIEVQLKHPNRCKKLCTALRDIFYRCCTKCGAIQPSEAASEPPPKRYIYFGP